MAGSEAVETDWRLGLPWGVSRGAAGKQVVGDPTRVIAGPSLAVICIAPPVEIPA